MARQLLPAERALCAELVFSLHQVRHWAHGPIVLMIVGVSIVGQALFFAAIHPSGGDAYGGKYAQPVVIIALVGGFMILVGVAARRLVTHKRVAAMARIRDGDEIEEAEADIREISRPQWESPTVLLGERRLRLLWPVDTSRLAVHKGEVARAAFHGPSGTILWIRPAELNERWTGADLRIFLEAHGERYADSSTESDLRDLVRTFLTK